MEDTGERRFRVITLIQRSFIPHAIHIEPDSVPTAIRFGEHHQYKNVPSFTGREQPHFRMLVCQAVPVDLVRHTGHHHPFHPAQRQVKDHGGILVERLLPEGIHRQMTHNDMHEAAGCPGLQFLDILPERFGQQAVRRWE